MRLPDPLLEALGSPTRLHAERRDDELVLSSDELDRDLDAVPPRRCSTSHAAQPGEVVAELRGVVQALPERGEPCSPASRPRSPAGTLTAVVGRSGSGKTTLLHLLAGLDRPTEGEVLVAGPGDRGADRAEAAAVRRDARRARHPGAGARPAPLRPRERRARPARAGSRGRPGRARRRALTEVGLGARLDHRADRLSAGERQRVAIARALAAEPELLLADEPTARLDQSNARAVGELLAALAHEHGTAVVCATHDAVVIEQADAQLELARLTAGASARATG